MKKLVLFSCVAGLSAFGFADDVLLTTPGYQGNRWSTPEIWQSGTIPGGAGVKIDTGDGGREVRMDQTNRIVGAFTTTAGTMPANGGEFKFSNANDGSTYTDSVAPQSIVNVSARNPTNLLVFANNGADAKIVIDDGNAGAAGPRQPFRHFYDVPVALEDNLLIQHLFAGTNAYGHYTIGSNAGPAAGVIFSQGISGEGKSITVDNAISTLGVIFMGDNAFTGDLVSKKGIVRAKDAVNLPRVGTPFGMSNTVVAVTEGSGVDLGGFITGEGQTLRLKGKRTDGGRENGVLFSSWAQPGAASEWRGAVTLEGDTWIGGTITGTGWPSNFYPWDTPGDLVVSGTIGETEPSAVHVTGLAMTRFDGANTFSGGLSLDEGYFTAGSMAAFGTGGVTFNGGTYRYTSDADANVLETTFAATSGNAVRLWVDDGVTVPFVDNAGFATSAGFLKGGEGTLVLTNAVGTDSRILAGTVVYDTTESDYVKFGVNPNAWQMSMSYAYNDCRFVVRGDPANQRWGCWYGTPQDGCALTFRAEDNQKLYLAINSPVNLLGYLNFETDGSGAWIQHEKACKDHDYPENEPYLVWDGRSFCRTESNRLGPIPDDGYAATWEDVSARAVDVTPTLAASPVPAGTVADVVRIGSSNAGEELVLTLAGDLKILSNTLLISADVKGDVRITGGAIKTSNIIRIINHNTNGVVTIESDLAVGDTANTQLAICGPGKTVLSGAKTFNGLTYITGGEVEIDDPDALGSGNAAWNSGYIQLSNDAILSFSESMDPVVDATNGRTEFTVKISATGGAIKVGDADDTVTFSANGIQVREGGRFRKFGPGKLVQTKNGHVTNSTDGNFKWPRARVEYLEGTCATDSNFPQDSGVLDVDNGVTLVGSRWISPNQAGAGGGGNRLETQGKRQLRIGPGGVTVDFAGEIATRFQLNDIFCYYGVDRCTEFFAGTGELKIVDSVNTESCIDANAYQDYGFAGRLTSYVPFKTVGMGGLVFAKADFHVPAGVAHEFKQVSEPYHRLRFGRLTGSGTLYAQAIQTSVPGFFLLGQDGVEEVADFSGKLTLEWGSNIMNALQLVKIGDNAQRISGAENAFYGNTIVRAGALLVGNDSPATNTVGGALGKAMVYVGDAETPEGATPSLLADGAYAIANEIRVHATSPASARPTIGGTEKADGATFSGKVTLYRDAAFAAGAGATVTFSGEIDTQGHALAKTGAGEVVLAGDLALDAGYAWAGGMLRTAGAVTCGGTLAIDPAALPETVRGDVYRIKIVSAAGGVSGTFANAELPGGWSLRYTATSVILAWGSRGYSVILR